MQDYRNNKIINLDKCYNIIENINKNNFIGKGGDGIVYKIESDKCGLAVVKIFKKINDMKNEIKILTKLKNIIDDNICPNFIYMYANRNNKVIFEYCDGDLEKWFEKEHNYNEWFSVIFQLYIGIFYMNKILNISHNDLKPKNILFKNIERSIFRYKIDSKIYDIDNFGILVVIADFTKYNNNKDNSDLQNILDIPNRIKINNIIKSNKYNIQNIYNKYKSNYKFNEYYNNKKKEIDNIFKNNNNADIKNKFFLKSLIYYLIENDLVEYNINTKNELLKSPPNEIINIIKKLDNKFNFNFYDNINNKSNYDIYEFELKIKK